MTNKKVKSGVKDFWKIRLALCFFTMIWKNVLIFYFKHTMFHKLRTEYLHTTVITGFITPMKPNCTFEQTTRFYPYCIYTRAWPCINMMRKFLVYKYILCIKENGNRKYLESPFSQYIKSLWMTLWLCSMSLSFYKISINDAALRVVLQRRVKCYGNCKIKLFSFSQQSLFDIFVK